MFYACILCDRPDHVSEECTCMCHVPTATKPRRNGEGLTYREWLDAAGLEKGSREHLLAWTRGEDPTDWKAERSQACAIA